MAGLTRVRRECSEIGVGTWQLLDTGDDSVFGLRYDTGDSTLVVLNNLSRTCRMVQLDLSAEEAQTATDLFADRRYEPLNQDSPRMHFESYGYRWLRVKGIY